MSAAVELSQNFTLLELTKSQTAERRGIGNDPSAEAIENLKRLAQNILQPVRDHFGIPFSPSSGYRSPELSLAIGSSINSQHCSGNAADFEVPGVDNYALGKWISEKLEFDQLILECYRTGDPHSGWVHTSWVPTHKRQQVLTYALGEGYQHGLKR